MPRVLVIIVLFLVMHPLLGAEVAVITTNKGAMTIELFPDAAPNTVKNFKVLASNGWYVGKKFYRVVKGHVIQAGSNIDNDPEQEPYKVNAEFNSRPHVKGTMGLARDEDPNSGSTEFYICHEERPHLDKKYTVFGQVIDGIPVLEIIANTSVHQMWLGEKKEIPFHEPIDDVVILSVVIKTKDSQ
jgi:cyclophilin family peptidyl-prolyl cis-trans isomerase